MTQPIDPSLSTFSSFSSTGYFLCFSWVSIVNPKFHNPTRIIFSRYLFHNLSTNWVTPVEFLRKGFLSMNLTQNSILVFNDFKGFPTFCLPIRLNPLVIPVFEPLHSLVPGRGRSLPSNHILSTFLSLITSYIPFSDLYHPFRSHLHFL